MSNIADNVYLKGTTGEVFVNNTKMIEINKINIKMTGTFEDFSPCGSYGTDHVYQGYDGDGTMEGVRIDTGIDVDLISGYKNGVMPEIKIQTTLTNPSTGAAESYMITGVKFTEVSPVDWESKNLVKRSMPFKFADITVISTID